MPRLPAPDPADLPARTRDFLSTLPPDPMVAMISHAAGTAEPFIRLARAQFTGLALSARRRELVIVTVAEYTECAFVAAQHEPMARDAGLPDGIRQLIRRNPPEAGGLGPGDRTLVRFTEAVVRGPRVPGRLFDEAREHLSDREIVEVIELIGYYWTFGRIATVLDVAPTRVYGD